jgi:hypothetical protein
MLEPHIEFKKIKTFRGMEGEGMNADIYINGVKCFFMRDDGNGGMTDFDRYDNRMQPSIAIESNVQLVDAWIKTIPDTIIPLKRKPTIEDPRTELVIKADYESYFNQKYEDFIKAKDRAKFEKKKMAMYKTAIVFGDPATPENYSFLNMGKPLNQLPKAWLQQAVNNAKAHYINGNVQFLNKNHLEFIGIKL